MAQFDPVLWRQRAWERLRRAAKRSSTGKPTPVQEAAWASDFAAVADIETVAAWCKVRCITVEFDKVEPGTNGVFDTAAKKVTVSSRATAQKQLITLLHECGHYLIGDKDEDDRFKMGYCMQHDDAIAKTFPHKLACVEEEFEAWHRGWKLAQRLGLSLDRASFDELRLSCLKSYIKWTTRKGK